MLYGLSKHGTVAFDRAGDDGEVKESHSTCLHLENACVDQFEVLDQYHFFLNPVGHYK